MSGKIVPPKPSPTLSDFHFPMKNCVLIPVARPRTREGSAVAAGILHLLATTAWCAEAPLVAPPTLSLETEFGGLATFQAGEVLTFAGQDKTGNTDSNGKDAKFGKNTYGLEFDGQGNLYLADAGNHRIRKITPDGTATTLAGKSRGYKDATGSSAKFNMPADIAVDSAGNLYVADSENHKIRKVTPEGVVTTVAGSSQGDKTGFGRYRQIHPPNFPPPR